MKIEFDEKCKACKGTGLYVGMAERKGFGVVCYDCKGTGKFHFSHEYENFIERELRSEVNRVVECNPGIILGGDLDFGGMSYQDWLDGKAFDIGTEMRLFTCPAWWYQIADYDKKPDWKECIGCGQFSNCEHFCNKDVCWIRWNGEFNNK
jgi:hypothetical protein